MGWIYCLTFSNGKSYVGLTTTLLTRRLSRHRAEAEHGARRSRIYAAWRKHGEPSVTVLAELPNENLAEAERLFIETFQTKIPNGYNVSDGGEGAWGAAVSEETRGKLRAAGTGRRMSPEAREKMRQAKLGTKQTPEHRAKIAAAHRGRAKAPEAVEKTRAANTGKRHTEETRAKISASRRGIRSPQESIDRAAAKHRGRKNAPETIERMRAAALRRYAKGTL